jgi:lysozyme
MQRLPDPSLAWPICLDGVYLLARREQCRNKTYLDWPGRKPTKGWGETSGVAIGDTPWTDAECDQRLLDTLTHVTNEVKAMCTVTPSENQLAGLVVCAYNIGEPSLKTSTIMRLHNQSQFSAAARAFSMWNKAHDATTKQLIEVDELTSRRAAEAALYLTPDEDGPHYPCPQAVAPEPSMAQSPTVQGGTVAVATGGLAILGSLQDVAGPLVTQAKDMAATLGLTPLQVMAGLLLIVGVVILYRRFAQRSQGVA